MCNKFQHKYRIATTRKSDWDYSWSGAYFITICTRNREPFFGHIEKGKMHLSHAGILGNVFWYEIISRNKNVSLGQFVVMPDHIHGILILEEELVLPADGEGGIPTEGETRHALSLRNGSEESEMPLTHRQLRYRNPGGKSVSALVGSYKSAVTKHANRLELPHGWQSRFHDQIIRDQRHFANASHYVRTNVSPWKPIKNKHCPNP